MLSTQVSKTTRERFSNNYLDNSPTAISSFPTVLDPKADNILQELVDKYDLAAFTEAELETPSDRKFVGDTTVYLSRRFGLPKEFGDVVLSDFGSAVREDKVRKYDAQPDVYRSPEVMLMTEWSYPIDTWNVGVMVRLDLLPSHPYKAVTQH